MTKHIALALLFAASAQADRLSVLDTGQVRARITGGAVIERDGTRARLTVDFTNCEQVGTRLLCRTVDALATTTTTTLPAICGDGVVESGEACDCLPDLYGRCAPPSGWSVVPSDSGGCADADGHHRYCADDCGACLDPEPCADGVLLPGDECDAWGGVDNDGCLAGGRCLIYDGLNCFCTSGIYP